jgi:hypothetical protein
VSHFGLAKEQLWKLKYFTVQKYNHQKKKSSKRNQNPSRYYYNSIITNLKFQTQAKMSSFKAKANKPIIIYNQTSNYAKTYITKFLTSSLQSLPLPQNKINLHLGQIFNNLE